MTETCLPCQMAADEAVVVQPETDGGGSAEWSGPIGMESQRTGDGRLIESSALRWDSLPVPLRWAMQDFGAHDGAYVVGKIEEIERLSYDEANERMVESGRDPLPDRFKDAVIIWGSGKYDLGSEYGREAYRQVKEELTPGISMDLDDIVIREEDGDSFSIVEGRVRAATQVAIPAFEGARIAVSEAAKETFDASLSAEDVFNWVEDAGGLPKYIKRIEKHLLAKGMDESQAIATAVNVVKKMCATGDTNFPGAQEVNAESRAEACAAVAEWEAKKAKAGAGEVLVASAAVFNHEWFQNPGLTGPTGLTVTEDGRVFGHIALWGTCHTASPQGRNVCTQPPHSNSNYSYFHTGLVSTTAGEVPVGRITMNTLHAGPRLSSTDTIHHYEHTGSVGAFVVAGEDAYGIWVAGAARPDADHTSLKAAPISGDWRAIGGNLELVGALSVNVPGFPVPRAQALVASGSVQSLVASGMVEVEERHADVQTLDLNDPQALVVLRARFKEMDRKDAADALAARVARLAALEKVRRVQQKFGLAFAGSQHWRDQWRMPKGNNGAGQWIEMPDSFFSGFSEALNDHINYLETNPDASTDTWTDLKTTLSEMEDHVAEASTAIREFDGERAIEHANLALGSLDEIDRMVAETDNGENVADDITAMNDNLRQVADADMTFLGEEILGASEGGDIGANEVALDDLPQATQGALGVDDMEGEKVFTSDRWPGMYEVYYTDPDTGERTLTSVADANGNAVGDTSGGGVENYVIYNADGSTSGSYKSVEEAADALAEMNGGLTAAALFAYNPDQWRVPKGNGRLSGRFIDMPDAALSDFETTLQSVMERWGGTPDGANRIGTNLDDALANAADAADALKAGDGDAAKAAAAKVDNALGAIEADIMEAADTDSLTPDDADEISASLKTTRETIGAVKDSDLSLLGDEGVGADVPETDIGGEDETVVGDTPAAPAAGVPTPAPVTQDAPADRPLPADVFEATDAALDAGSNLENTMMGAIDSGGWRGSDEGFARVGDKLQEVIDSIDALHASARDGRATPDQTAKDLATAQTALEDLESMLIGAAEEPGAMDDDVANQIGTALDDLFVRLGDVGQRVSGSQEPPPFATRKYVRQWLGRRGIRLGSFSLI
jgi:hypothetical protein